MRTENDGVPANIPATKDGFSSEQVKALGYAVAIPKGGEAKPEVL